jgi:hypothetical protein
MPGNDKMFGIIVLFSIAQYRDVAAFFFANLISELSDAKQDACYLRC